MSVFHGGPNPDFLAPIVINMIMGNIREPEEEDIPELTFKDIVHRVRSYTYILY